jgi:4-alpha-glucanotransferase
MPVDTRRSSGVLLHVTSLPGPFGLGDLGPAADAFLDRLAGARQGIWQVLPLGPTGMGNSPYGGLSSFAGNPLLVSPQRLAEDGLLAREELGDAGDEGADHADFAAAREARAPLLRRAFEALEARRAPHLADELEAWAAAPEQQAWLADWALFAAIRSRMEKRPWPTWPAGLRRREPQALDEARRELAADVRFHRFVQYAFARQWSRLRAHANERGVQLFGDLPMYPAGDAADIWARPDLFELDGDGHATKVAGVPPDYFSADGQRWGNPLFRWDRVEGEAFVWWLERLRAQLRWFDLVRLDHFRGYESYWEIDAASRTARDGKWTPAPGSRLLAAARSAMGALPLVAEDLGVITDEVIALRREAGLPGMRVLQFGFGAEPSNHRPHAIERDTVLYTGTHDNDTTAGWFAASSRDDRRRAIDYLGCRPRGIAWAMVRAAWTSVAERAIAPAQDLLGLGSEARMNRPGEALGNWSWRMRAGAFDDRLVDRLRRLTEISDRAVPRA